MSPPPPLSAVRWSLPIAGDFGDLGTPGDTGTEAEANAEADAARSTMKNSGATKRASWPTRSMRTLRPESATCPARPAARSGRRCARRALKSALSFALPPVLLPLPLPLPPLLDSSQKRATSSLRALSTRKKVTRSAPTSSAAASNTLSITRSMLFSELSSRCR